MTEPLCCEATTAAETLCTGWVPSGWKWHGCAEPIGHSQGRRRVTHRCRCGVTWGHYLFAIDNQVEGGP